MGEIPTSEMQILTLMAEREELKSLLMREKEESEKVGLKLKRVTDFIFLGSKVTADVDCSHEIKRRLLLRRKAMTNLGSVLKSRDTTLPTKV